MRTLAIAFLTGILGAVLAVVGGEITTRAHHVSDFEGGRGMLLAFVILPAGFIVGAIIGGVAAKKWPGPGFGGFAQAQLIGWGITAALALMVFGFAWWRAPRPPQVGGEDVDLAIEVRMPEGRTLPDTTFTVLFTSQGYGDDRRNADLYLDRTSMSDGRVVIPGLAILYNQSSRRYLVVNDTDGKHYWFDLPLRGRPAAKDLEWTDWWPAPGQSATRDINGNGGFQIRYRLQKTPAGDPGGTTEGAQQ